MYVDVDDSNFEWKIKILNMLAFHYLKSKIEKGCSFIFKISSMNKLLD